MTLQNIDISPLLAECIERYHAYFQISKYKYPALSKKQILTLGYRTASNLIESGSYILVLADDNAFWCIM
jgi:hypothetical protein